MARKVGALSGIGLLVLILSIIVYFSSFTITYSSRDLIIGITGMFLGFVAVIVDYLLAKKKDILKEIQPRLDIFGKIVGVTLFVWIIDVIFYSTAIGYYAPFLGGVVCVLVILPMMVVGLAIFLIYVRTPLGKKLTRKNIIIFCAIMGIVLLILPTYLIWPSISPTYKGNLYVNQLSFSGNNERILVRAEGSNIITGAPNPGFLATYQIWDLPSGTIVWNTTSDHYPVIDLNQYNEMALSPDGEFLSFSGNNTLYSSQTRTYCSVYNGDFLGWMMNGNRFITANETQLYIQDAVNKTILNTIVYPHAGQMIPSYNGSEIAVVPKGNEATMLTVITVASNGSSTNTWYHFNTSIYRWSTKISWSPDGTKLQLVYPSPEPNGDYHYSSYRVLVWDVTTTRLVQNISFTYYNGDHGNNGLLETWFGAYAIRDDDHDQIIVYNISTGGTEHINSFDKNLGAAALSPDKSLVAGVSGGSIAIKNTSTGITVQRLILPVYEIKRAIPGFECIVVVCAIAFFVILQHKRRKK